MNITILITTLLALTEPQAVREQVQPRLFPAGKIEVALWDDTRVDILTDDYAIEVDWAGKWAEAVGQSLYYAILTDRKPGIVLLTKDRRADLRHLLRCQVVAAKHGIHLWVWEVAGE